LAWEQWHHPASTRHPSPFPASPCGKIHCLAFDVVVVVAADVVGDVGGAAGGAVAAGFAGVVA
jgi:hypothetical protein